MSETKRLVLIDGSGYIFRAFFALPPLTDPKGVPVGAVFGFCNMLFRLVQDMAGDQLVVVFDKGGASFGTRSTTTTRRTALEPPPELVPQFPLVREAARAFGLPVIEVDDYEADDLIATYARAGPGAGPGGDRRLLRQGPDAADRPRRPDVRPDEAEGDRPRRGDRALRGRPGAGARRPGAGRRHLRQRAGRAGDRGQDRGPAAPGVPQPGRAAGQRGERSSSRSGARTCSPMPSRRACRGRWSPCARRHLCRSRSASCRSGRSTMRACSSSPARTASARSPSGSSPWPTVAAEAARPGEKPAEARAQLRDPARPRARSMPGSSGRRREASSRSRA